MVIARTASIFAAALMGLLVMGHAGLAATDPPAGATSYTVDGITVIQAPSSSPLISVIAGFEGGLATGDADNPEIGTVASDLVTSSGSIDYPKEALQKFLSRTSTSLYGAAGLRDYTYRMTSTKSNFDEAWKVLASVIRRPAFDSSEFRTAKARHLIQVQSRWSRPERQAYEIADSLMTLTHPVLSRRSFPQDVERLSIADIQSYVKRISERSRMVLVVVGNISREELTRKLADLRMLPAGSYTRPQLPPISMPAKPALYVVDRSGSPTTYIYGAFAGPTMTAPDYWALAVGLRHLREVLFEEIRTKRNLSYAPSSFLQAELGNGVGFVSVSTTLPDSSIAVIYRELEKMRQGDFTSADLEDTKQAYLTNYYMRRMTSADQADAIYTAQQNMGDWRKAFDYEAIAAVDKPAVQAAFQRWARNLAVGVVGRRSMVTNERYLFAE